MTTNADLAQQLRDACSRVRTKSFPLSDLIPLMQRAADELDWDGICGTCDGRGCPTCRPEPEPARDQEAIQIKADRYDWLASGLQLRQGQRVPDRGGRHIDRSPTQALMSFMFWCSPEELGQAIDAERAKRS